MFEGVDEVFEMFKGSFPFSMLFFLPILVIISPIRHVGATHEFTVYRMQQYDLQGVAHGSRNALINVEVRSIDSTSFTRRCVMSLLKELAIDKYREMLTQNAGGLLVLLPTKLLSLKGEDRERIMELEQDLMQEDSQMPVYFTYETPELLDIYDRIKSSTESDHAATAVEALLSGATANGYQIVVSGSQASALSDFQVVNIQGKLTGAGIEEQLPTIVVIAHYDAYAIAPTLAVGADSNGSGVVALLELARLFSKLYTNSRTHAKYNIVFLLSGAGKFNYQGTKKWIEDQIESTESSLLGDLAYVLCLDSLGSSTSLNLHVSKPPKAGSASETFYKNLETSTKEFSPQDSTLNVVHKKINLAEQTLAWEHERFSIRRMPAFTLSHLASHKERSRYSLLDMRENIRIEMLATNIKVIAETLAKHIFNLTESNAEIFTAGLEVKPELLSASLDYLTHQSRAAQLLPKDSPVIASLEQVMARYLKDVKKHSFKADKRDPEFVFYDGVQYTIHAYNVKPAVFDLFLALVIGIYLALLYLVMQNFSIIQTAMKSLLQKRATTTAKATKHENSKFVQ